MSYVCELCNVNCSSATLLTVHFAGKKHVSAIEEAKRLQDFSERSVFLTNFREPVKAEEIEAALKDFGELERIILNKTSGKHAIVEFRNADESRQLLQSMKKLKVGNNLVDVKERKVDFDANLHVEELCADDVHNWLQGIPIGEGINALVSHFNLNSEAMEIRYNFAKSLEQFLQKFFIPHVEVHLFGSTTTGLAFPHSDLDLNFVVGKEKDYSKIVVPSLPSSSTTHAQMDTLNEDMESSISNSVKKQFDIKELRNNPFTRATFMNLNKSERAHLLTKLVNEFRKETHQAAKIIPVLDARCPLVRFTIRLHNTLKQNNTQSVLSCELSVDNMLGERKANFVRDVINADCSGILRKFFFISKLWAHCNGLFLPDGKQLKSHWSSYTISLLVVAFLQFKKFFGPILLQKEKPTIQGWKIAYELPSLDLSSINLLKLLKEFFVFLYNTVQDSQVYCIQEGLIRSKDDFVRLFLTNLAPESPMQKFKTSLVNVQDPLELVHNVGANISRSSLARLRKSLMFSIFALKRNDNINAIFQIKQLQAKFSADTEANFEHNMEQKKASNVLTFTLENTTSHNSSAIFDAFRFLFNEILFIGQAEEPMIKRSRPDSLLNQDGGDCFEILRDKCDLRFDAHFCTWLGRRSLRRRLEKEFPNTESPLTIEKKVSEEFIKCKVKTKEPILRFSVQLFLCETESPNSSGGENLHPGISGTQECYAIFKLENDAIADATQNFRDLLRFLSTFVPKYLPLALRVYEQN